MRQIGIGPMAGPGLLGYHYAQTKRPWPTPVVLGLRLFNPTQIMHSSTSRYLVVTTVAALSVFGMAGCSKSDRAEAKADAKEMVADTKDAVSEGWANVKSFTYEQRNDFTASAKAMSASMDAKLSELRANYSEANASASRKAAMAEIKNSEADYKQKLDALGNATADTWDSAKQNVIASWDRLQASYYKARAD